ncbi:MAG TPA: hypothetical protein VMV69_28740 [Pirellulales bacterium]|nr:hypothetical protein [Pirellulales bacterium]
MSGTLAPHTARCEGTRVSCRPGVVRIESRRAFSMRDERWREFVTRVLTLDEVESVAVDRVRGIAQVHHAPPALAALNGSSATRDASKVLERLSAALDSAALDSAASDSAASDSAMPKSSGRPLDRALAERIAGLAEPARFRLFRRGASVSTWEIIHDRPGRLRVRDTAVRQGPEAAGPAVAAGPVARRLRELPGVRDVAIGAWTGSVLICFDRTIVGRDAILSLLDGPAGKVGGPLALSSPAAHGESEFANASLLVAFAGEFLVPALLPLSAVLLVAGNLANFRDAWRQLRRRQAGVPILHTSIVAATLATGGYVASSLMNWLLVFWEKRRAKIAAGGHELLAAALRRPRQHAWLCREGAEIETPAADLRPGDVVVARGGDMVPADGRIISGAAVLEEPAARGHGGLVCRGVGDDVLEGSLVLEGELRLAVSSVGGATFAENIDRALASAAGAKSGANPPGPPRIAERAVAPVLVTAGVGLLVGDAAAAAAILRPDYSTGPRIGDSLTQLFQLASCLDEGIVVRRADVLQRMADVDLLLLDDDAALGARRPELAGVEPTGDLTSDELLAYAECALRRFHDPRSAALAAAGRARGLRRLELRVEHRAAWAEIRDDGRCLRVHGLSSREVAYRFDHASLEPGAWVGEQAPAPLGVYCDDRLAGVLTFSRGDVFAAKDVVLDLRARCGMQVELLAPGRSTDFEALVDALGIDGLRCCPADESKAGYIHECRGEGHRVAYVGDCLHNPLAARAADVAISLRPDLRRHDDAAGAWLLEPNYDKLPVLRDISASQRRQLQWQYGLTLVPNVACVAGALLFGFTSLAVVVLSNLGTYAVYTRSVADLSRARGRLLDRQGRFGAGVLPKPTKPDPSIL